MAFFEKLGSDIRKGENVSLKDVRTAVDAILLNHGEAMSNVHILGVVKTIIKEV